MSRYIVKIPCEGTHDYSVSADDPEEAIQKVACGLGCYQSHDALNENLDTGTWMIKLQEERP